MAKPRVFISSIYYDLKHVRASIEVFVESLGFDPILAEYGSIAFDPSQPLDESCYREAQSSDIFVLIIGGRYGSIATSQATSSRQREEELESITRREFSKAHEADIPVFVLIDHGVQSEYQTYLRNKENSTINYAHVDSLRIFKFIEFVYSRQRNNPVHPFEKGSDIEGWLREQWAGIFQELLRQRKDNSRFSDLASQIRQLEAVNTTLKSYLETVLQTVSPEKSNEIIEKENKTLTKSKMIELARRNQWFKHVIDETNIPAEKVLDLHLAIESVGEIIPVFEEKLGKSRQFIDVMEALDDFEEARQDFNRLRKMLNQKGVRFTKKFLEDLIIRLEEIRNDPELVSEVLSEDNDPENDSDTSPSSVE